MHAINKDRKESYFRMLLKRESCNPTYCKKWSHHASSCQYSKITPYNSLNVDQSIKLALKHLKTPTIAEHDTIITIKRVLKMWLLTDIRTNSTDFFNSIILQTHTLGDLSRTGDHTPAVCWVDSTDTASHKYCCDQTGLHHCCHLASAAIITVSTQHPGYRRFPVWSFSPAIAGLPSTAARRGIVNIKLAWYLRFEIRGRLRLDREQ